MKGLGLCMLLLTLALPGCQQSGEKEGTADKSRENARDETGLMKIKDLGDIRLRFFPDKAPGHVDNFKKLARQGFYDATPPWRAGGAASIRSIKATRGGRSSIR